MTTWLLFRYTRAGLRVEVFSHLIAAQVRQRLTPGSLLLEEPVQPAQQRRAIS